MVKHLQYCPLETELCYGSHHGSCYDSAISAGGKRPRVSCFVGCEPLCGYEW